MRAGGRQVTRTFGAAEELSAAMDGFGGASRAASSSAAPAAAGGILGAQQASRGRGSGRGSGRRGRARGASDQPGSQIAGATSRLLSTDDFDLALDSAPSGKARQPARSKGQSPAGATKPGYDAAAETGTRATHDSKADSPARTASESNAKSGTNLGATGRLGLPKAEVGGSQDGGADDTGTDTDENLDADGGRGIGVEL